MHKAPRSLSVCLTRLSCLHPSNLQQTSCIAECIEAISSDRYKSNNRVPSSATSEIFTRVPLADNANFIRCQMPL